MKTIYPRFLGMDGQGDFVWELANGRWTWGSDLHDVLNASRTFEPERYIEKYGRPIDPEESIDRKAEAEQDPAELAKLYVDEPPAAPEPVPADRGGPLGAPGRRGAHRALTAMLATLGQWIESSRENHQAMGHRHENTGDECWRTFAPSDIRDMVNDAARQLTLSPFPAPTNPEEDR